MAIITSIKSGQKSIDFSIYDPLNVEFCNIFSTPFANAPYLNVSMNNVPRGTTEAINYGCLYFYKGFLFGYYNGPSTFLNYPAIAGGSSSTARVFENGIYVTCLSPDGNAFPATAKYTFQNKGFTPAPGLVYAGSQLAPYLYVQNNLPVTEIGFATQDDRGLFRVYNSNNVQPKAAAIYTTNSGLPSVKRMAVFEPFSVTAFEAFTCTTAAEDLLVYDFNPLGNPTVFEEYYGFGFPFIPTNSNIAAGPLVFKAKDIGDPQEYTRYSLTLNDPVDNAIFQQIVNGYTTASKCRVRTNHSNFMFSFVSGSNVIAFLFASDFSSYLRVDAVIPTGHSDALYFIDKDNEEYLVALKNDDTISIYWKGEAEAALSGIRKYPAFLVSNPVISIKDK